MSSGELLISNDDFVMSRGDIIMPSEGGDIIMPSEGGDIIMPSEGGDIIMPSEGIVIQIGDKW